MRALRALLALGSVTLLCPIGAYAVDGVNEINVTSIVAAGGYPFTIPVPGSYVLTGDLAPPPGTGALVAGADNIEIDLNGFTITSPPGPAATGIDSAGFTGLTVRRGVVQGFGIAGMIAGTNSKVIETKLSGNGAGVTAAVDCLVVMNTIAGNAGAPACRAALQDREQHHREQRRLRDRRRCECDRAQPDRRQRGRRHLRVRSQHDPAERDQREHGVRDLRRRAAATRRRFRLRPYRHARTSSATRSATRLRVAVGGRGIRIRMPVADHRQHGQRQFRQRHVLWRCLRGERERRSTGTIWAPCRAPAE